MNVVNHNCPTCGAALKFNVERQKWICEYCKVQFDLENLEHNIKNFEQTKVSDLDIYECCNCGAQIVTSSNTVATTCVYCNSSVIIKKNLIGDYKPDFIIPFRNTKEQILKLFSKNLIQHKLSDKDFNNIKNITCISSLYVPYWLVSCDVMASIKGIFNYRTDNKTVNKYCRRLGKMTLDRVPAGAKSNLDNDLLQGIEPFNYKEMKSFAHPYLAGSFAECYDVSKEEILKNQIQARIQEAAIERLVSTIAGSSHYFSLQEKNFFANKYKYEYILVPVWFVTMEYQGKKYEFCINDQTVKISGKRQINKLKIVLFYLVAFLLPFSILGIYLNIISTNELIWYLYILIVIIFFTLITNRIKSYTRLRKGKESIDYIKKGTFVLMESSNVDSF